VEYIACIGGMRNAYKILVRKFNGKIILEWILGIKGGKLWTEFMQLKIGTRGRLL